MASLGVVSLLFCLFGLVNSMVIRQPDPYWDKINVYCGSRLAEELQVICRGKYNELPAGEDQSIRRRRQMGIPLITEECCYQPCTRRTLRMYCAPVS